MTIEKEMREFAEQVFRNFGLDILSSKIIAILYTEPEEVALEELSKKTGYSLASISNKTRFLENVEMIEKVKKPGSKKVYYYMEKDLFKMMQKKLEKAYEAEINPAKQKVPEIIEKYKNKKLNEKSKKKLEIMQNYYQQIIKLDKVFRQMQVRLKNGSK